MRLCVTDVMCYACNSYMAQCKFDKLAANTNNNVFQARCTSKCFTRQGEDEGNGKFTPRHRNYRLILALDRQTHRRTDDSTSH